MLPPYARLVPGRLIICATPIGNLDDATPRLREALAAADVVFAEDTRRTAKLLRHLGERELDAVPLQVTVQLDQLVHPGRIYVVERLAIDQNSLNRLGGLVDALQNLGWEVLGTGEE